MVHSHFTERIVFAGFISAKSTLLIGRRVRLFKSLISITMTSPAVAATMLLSDCIVNLSRGILACSTPTLRN